ncbi:unnamed protein product [Brachionus calyciflorus]|uniref:Intersectin-1 n=1 Tax=Brachionus calyciflorus TaxID=104777 RepID=A0A813RZZ3_9BILA|nr:unnamed protein product [Brachionus calyciflorus]
MDNPDLWKITPEERLKHNSTFSQLSPLSGSLLTGEQAKAFFLKSGLPTPVLGQIWTLADLNKDGSLDKKEFSIACFLIKKVLTSPQGASILPSVCPKLLQMEPTQITATPPLATPLNTPLIPIGTTPLFQPTFPNPLITTQIPISGISLAPTPTPMPSIIPTPLPTIPTASAPAFTPLATGFTSPPPVTNTAAAITAQSNQSGAIFTPLAAVNPNLPNPLAPIPSTSRAKYGQIFQSTDTGSTGFLTGQQAKNLLVQTGLPQAVLVQVWNLADYDKDGKLSYEEFIIAMHLCDFAKAGNILPSSLPVELQPQRSRASSAVIPNTTLSPEVMNNSGSESSPTLANKNFAHSFEDKRKENYDRGNAVLEAKRQALREQEEREKREREEKERIEFEKRQKLKEEQEKRRLAEMEKQLERQRLIDMQREEERRKAIEQREKARNELIRQQRIEWEKQKKIELENQKAKLQEQLSISKAKDKNLEFDMQTMNEKILTYKTKINDNQTNLIDLNNKLDSTRKINSQKQTQLEAAEREMKEFSQKLARLAQEKYHLNEEMKNLNQDSALIEEYNREASLLKSKEMAVLQLKNELSNLEMQISAARTQLEVVKHELEVTKTDENELIKENERLSKLIELKKNSLATVTSPKQTAIPSSATTGSLNKINNTMPTNKTTSSSSLFKQNQFESNSRSGTPKDNYEAMKDEIFKIQQTTTTSNKSQPTSPVNNFDPFSPGPTVTSSKTETTPATGNFNVDWTSAFDQQNESTNGFGVDHDPFTSFNENKQDTSKVDPFASFTAVQSQTNTNNNTNFDDIWSSNNNQPVKTSNAAFETAFGDFPTSPSVNNGFGTDDNWASNAFTNQTSPSKNTNTNSSFNNTNTADWAAFNVDETSKPSIKNTIDYFNTNLKMQSPVVPSHSSVKSNSSENIKRQASLQSPTANWIKFKALYTFEAQREDELTIREGDIVNVDLSYKTDEGWLFGELKGKNGVFPASFTAKLSDLDAIQEESFANFSTQSAPTSAPVFNNDFVQPAQQQVIPNQLVTNIKNYYISIYSYLSNETGDLNFREFEIINVISQNEDWLTGQIVGSGIDASNPLRSGIFPANFVIKFNLPIEYIGKYTISMAIEPYVAQNNGELSLDPGQNQLVAIKKISPDGKWSFGESFDSNNQMQRGWFPVSAATALIDAGAPPIYSPAKTLTQSPSNNNIELKGNNNNNNDSSLSLNQSPPPPQAQKSLFNSAHTSFDNNNLQESRQSSIQAFSTPTNTPSGISPSSVNTIESNQVKITTSVVEEQKPVEAQSVSTSELPNVVIDRVVALYDFNPQTPEAIGFPKDAVINILEKSGDWWLGEYNGKIGILPYNYVQSLSQPAKVIQRENTNSFLKANRSVSLQNLSNLNRQSISSSSRKLSAIIFEAESLPDEDINAYINSDFESVLDENISLSDDTASLGAVSQTDLSGKNKMRVNVVNEILQTEKNYVRNLKLIVEKYKIPLEQRRFLSPIELDNLFVNIDEIISLNVKFYNSLSKRIEEAKQYDQNPKIGQCLLEYLPRMQVYVKFVSSKRINEDALYEKIRSSPEYTTLFATNGDTTEFLLKKLLLLPMQRLTQYSLLIDKLIKYSSDSDEDYQNLKIASKLIVDLIKSINNEVGKKDDLEKLEWLDEHINVKGIGFKFKSSTNMMGPRKLYYYGPLVKVSGKELYAFLFNDTLVITESNETLQSEVFKAKSNGKTLQYQLYKQPVLLDNINVVQAKHNTTTLDCSFQIIIGEKEYTFKTTNPTLRNEWVKQLQKAIDIFKQKKRGLIQSISATNLSQKTAIGRFLLLVMEAQDLMLEPSNERSVFCEASMGVQKFNTQPINSANPKWNTSMQFQIYDLNKDVINVMVYDKKIYKPNIFLGKTELKIFQIYREQMKDNQENNPIIRMFRMSNVPNGKIMLKMSISLYN